MQKAVYLSIMELSAHGSITMARNRIVVDVLFWICIFLIIITHHQYYGFDDKAIGVTLLHDLVILFPQILASYFLASIIVPKFFLKKRYLLLVIYFLAGSYLICVLARFLTIKVAEPLIGIPSKDEESILSILTDIRKLIFIYFFSNYSVAFVFLVVKMLMEQYALRQHNLMLSKEKSIAELQYLKAQLNPHFLFNTLNNIYSLSIIQHPATSASIARMSEILDHIIYKSQENEVPLSEEIKLLENYIGLEKLRYDERLEVIFTQKIVKEIMIAPLMLLSLVENAFKHAGNDVMGSIVIEIELESTQERFTLRVSNPRGAKASEPGGKSSGLGLSNLKKQLELTYPHRHKLETTVSMLTFTVELSLYFAKEETGPKNKKPYDESKMPARRR